MCDHEDSAGGPLTFARFLALLRRPPFEPCESEFDYYTRAEYDAEFDEAVRLHYRPVISYIAGVTRDYGNAPDLAQQVFANVYNTRSSFEKAYIYRAARNAALKEGGRTRRRQILEARWAGIRRYGDRGEARRRRHPPDAEYIERTREGAVRRAVERLPERLRAPLLLYAGGKSCEQVGELTGANEGMVRARICRAKSLLRKRLSAYL